MKYRLAFKIHIFKPATNKSISIYIISKHESLFLANTLKYSYILIGDNTLSYISIIETISPK